AWDGLKEQKRVDLEVPTRAVTVSKQGVLALVETPQTELWLLDSSDLAPLKRGPLPDIVRVTSGPALGFALAEGKPGDERVPRVRVLDLGRFTVTKVYGERDLLPRDAARGTTSGSYEVTPDGKYLFGVTSLAQLVRWQITGNLLKPDVMGPAIATGAGGEVVVSVDGKYVCLLHPEGNQTTAPDHPLLERYGTYVYGVKNL